MKMFAIALVLAYLHWSCMASFKTSFYETKQQFTEKSENKDIIPYIVNHSWVVV